MSKMPTALDHCSQWFDEQGTLSKIIQGYQPRKEQLEMSATILSNIAKKKDIICEAGTGIGKTLAYLLPYLDSGKKVIIATASKTLQKQLFDKDIPLACKVFKGGSQYALLKGKENYISKIRLQGTLEESHFLTPIERSHLNKIKKWADHSHTGDKADCFGVPSNSPVWKLVCNKAKDPIEKESFHNQARIKAKAADIIIVNQHLLCLEIILANYSKNSSIFENTKHIIVDEAHRFRDIATIMFSQRVSSNNLNDLTKDAYSAIVREALSQEKELTPAITYLKSAINDTARYFNKYQAGSYSWLAFCQHSQIQWLQPLIEQFDLCYKALEEQGKESIESVRKQLLEYQQFFQNLAKLKDQKTPSNEAFENTVVWVELYKNGSFLIYLTPVQIDQVFQDYQKPLKLQWLFTSATLSVVNQFDHFKNSLGIDQNAHCQSWNSPFNYQKQVCWYHPKDIENTNHPDHIKSYINALLPVCQLTQGRAFLLFCSYKAINQAQEILSQHSEFNLLVQGTDSNEQLIENFKTQQNSLLLGTASFWEGIDVRGQQLSLVAIDKLPFTTPDDPLYKAREEWYLKHKLNPFIEESLPKAVISLKQGLGRLIRDINDIGIIMIGDNRLYQKSYGKTFLNSLPPYSKTDNLDQVKEFWKKHTTNANT